MGLQEGIWPYWSLTPKPFIYSTQFSERVLSLEVLKKIDDRVLFGEESAEAKNPKDEIFVQSPGRASLKLVIHKMAVLSWIEPHHGCLSNWSLERLAKIKESLLLWAVLGSGRDHVFEHFFNLPKCLIQSPSIALPVLSSAPYPPHWTMAWGVLIGRCIKWIRMLYFAHFGFQGILFKCWYQILEGTHYMNNQKKVGGM